MLCNPNFLVSWPTDKCEGSKWGRIWPGIHWAWSQTCDTSLHPLIGQNSQWEAENPNFLISWICQSPLIGQDSQDRLTILIFLLFDQQTSVKCPNGEIFPSPLIDQVSQCEKEFCQISNEHGPHTSLTSHFSLAESRVFPMTMAINPSFCVSAIIIDYETFITLQGQSPRGVWKIKANFLS